MLAHPAFQRSSYRDAVLASKPLRYYRCDDTSGTVLRDLCGTADATITGTPPLRGAPGVPGIPDSAGFQTANATAAYALAGNAAPPASAYTLMCWHYNTNLANGGIFGRWQSSSGLLLFSDPAKLGGLHQGVNLGLTTAVNNRWYHLCLVWTGTAVSFYVNGVLVGGPTANAVSPGSGAANWAIGTYYNGGVPSTKPNGTTAECVLWSRALTVGEIAHFYTLGSGG